MVGVGVADLDEDDAGNRRCFQEVVRAPPQRLDGVPQLRSHGSPEVYDAPRQQRRRKRHRKAELYVVAGVVVATG